MFTVYTKDSITKDWRKDKNEIINKFPLFGLKLGICKILSAHKPSSDTL